MTALSQALEDLRKYYGLTDFHEVNLNMEDINRPFIKFKVNGNEEWTITLERDIQEEGENGVL